MKINTILFFMLLFGIFNNAFAQPDNTNISETSAFEGEPYLAINPNNPQNMIIAWMADDLSTGFKISIKTKTSFDGGNTWNNQVIHPHISSTWHSADPSMGFRPNGTAYLVYIDYRQAPDSGGVFISHSTDGGIIWSNPTQVWDVTTEDKAKLPLDRPWLAIDNSGKINDGMFYISTKPAPWILPPNRPYLKFSEDSGETWSNFRYVDTTGHLVGNLIQAPMAFPSVTADGAICLAYPSYLASQSIYPKYYLAKSYNKCQSFEYYDLLKNPVIVKDTSYKIGYILASNPNNAQQMALAYCDRRNGDADVYVATTNDGGVNWNDPLRVNDDSIGNGKGQDLFWISYSKSGKLVASWRDRRNSTGKGFDQPSDIYSAISLDNGNSFGKNIRMSNIIAPFDTILTLNGNDFMGCQLVNDSIYAAWGDVRSGTLNIYFAKTSIQTGSGTPIIYVNPEDENPVKVFPNPANSYLNIKLRIPDLNQITVKLFDIMGREMINFNDDSGIQSFNIDISKLKPGFYNLEVNTNDNKIYHDKIEITR